MAYLEGQILADVENQQLVIYLGFYQFGTKKEPKFAALFMTEERFVNTGKDITLDDCITNVKTTHIEGIPHTFEDFAKVKQAIKDTDKACAQYSRWGDESKGEPSRVYEDRFTLTVVDDMVVFEVSK